MSPATEYAEETVYDLDPKLWEQIMQHPGEWVVATETEVIAHGPDAQEILRIAGARGIEQPLLFNVPEDPGISFLL
jgi:hypothetical protein